jgi:hypothetical protein
VKPARAVTVIPPTINRFTPETTGVAARKRVAAYARVSTDSEEQLTSYEAQVVFVNRKIPHIINEKYPTFNKKILLLRIKPILSFL